MPATATQVLTFEAGGQALAIATAEVAEVVSAPRITRVPQAPAGLQGVTSLRGKVVPILSVEVLLGGAAGAAPARVIVLTGDDAVGLAVDRVSAMRDVTREDNAGGALAEFVETEAGPARLLHRERLLAGVFAGVHRRVGAGRPHAAPAASAEVDDRADVAFLQFALAGQAYALPLEQVREITTTPGAAIQLPHADAVMLGVMPFRGTLLPLISTRALLGLAPRPAAADDRVVVATLGGASLGLVVDEVRSILRVRDSDVGAVPGVLNRGAGEARIDAIVRSPGGLVSVLATERIFQEDTVAQILAEAGARERDEGGSQDTEGAMEQFVIFRLADEAYGLPVAAVREVVRLPEAVTRMPGAPDYVAGVMNHRGLAVPLIDQRRRFAVAGDARLGQQRVIVATVDDLVAGFVVDAVEQILSVPAEALRPAPDLGASDALLFDRVATLEIDGRLVLLVDPRQLLDQAERDILRDVTRPSNATPA